jgi:hypothetical protein
LFPVNVSVPVPILWNSVVDEPPVIAPVNVASWPLVSKMALPGPIVTLRFEVKFARNCSVPPPLKLSMPVAEPRLTSLLTASVPAVIVVLP